MSGTRRVFLKRAAATLGSTIGEFAIKAADSSTETYYRRAVQSNAEAISGTVAELSGPRGPRANVRRFGTQLEILTGAFCAPESSGYRSAELIPRMQSAADALIAGQHSDGTIDAGNLHSPPDTGFVVETTGRALAVLRQMEDARLKRLCDTLGKFLLAAGEALVAGGVHTPNHRWVICSALARIHSLFPAPKYTARIDDWLVEGVYIDADGQFEERSTGIYSRVTDGALVTMARLLNRPALLEPVRKNLEMTVYYMHPDGELETLASRRQDQLMRESIGEYYPEYRYLAIIDRNPLFSAITRLIESAANVIPPDLLIRFLDEPRLKDNLPEAAPLPADYNKLFGNSALARIRRQEISATVYGGSDWPLGVASGLASNPTFFTFRKEKAVLQSLRMGCQFFSEGAFRSEGLQLRGRDYVLHQRFDVPYYQPLPKSARNPAGDYPLTPARDSRFWSKLDFPHRQMSNIQTLEQNIVVREEGGAFELHFDVTGPPRVPVTLEFAFRPGGDFGGSLREVTRDNSLLLEEGSGTYSVGHDTIEFGPGSAEHEYLNLAGSSYAAHGAPLLAAGRRVYITGFTPFQRVITVRGKTG